MAFMQKRDKSAGVVKNSLSKIAFCVRLATLWICQYDVDFSYNAGDATMFSEVNRWGVCCCCWLKVWGLQYNLHCSENYWPWLYEWARVFARSAKPFRYPSLKSCLQSIFVVQRRAVGPRLSFAYRVSSATTCARRAAMDGKRKRQTPVTLVTRLVARCYPLRASYPSYVLKYFSALLLPPSVSRHSDSSRFLSGRRCVSGCCSRWQLLLSRLRLCPQHRSVIVQRLLRLGDRLFYSEFYVAAPVVWNDLPLELRSASASQYKLRGGLRPSLYSGTRDRLREPLVRSKNE